MLQIALDRYQKEGSRFVLEIALDLGYNRALLKSIKDLKGNDRVDAEHFLGNVIDSRLIIWSYRFRIYAGMEPEQILNYTLENGVQVRFQDIKAIAMGADLEPILRDIFGEDLVAQIQGIPLESAVQELEIIFLRHRLAQAQKERLKPPFSLGLLFAYEAQLESEALDLITILESIQLGLSGDEIRSHLILGQGAYV
jgi:V/A-type H+-transporting ATPase subunit C